MPSSPGCGRDCACDPAGRDEMRFKVIFAALKPSVTDQVVDAAKECGISGATIVPGRGTGMHEAKTFSA